VGPGGPLGPAPPASIAAADPCACGPKLICGAFPIECRIPYAVTAAVSSVAMPVRIPGSVNQNDGLRTGRSDSACTGSGKIPPFGTMAQSYIDNGARSAATVPSAAHRLRCTVPELTKRVVSCYFTGTGSPITSRCI
jgi:hypothetical protein